MEGNRATSGGGGGSKEDIRRMMRQVAAKMASSSSTSSSTKQSSSSAASAAAAAAASASAAAADSDSVKGHPFARYNSLNQLTCILCGCPVKSSLLWRAHLASRQHRANAEALKSQGGDRAVDILSGGAVKRRLLESQQQLLLQQKRPHAGGLGLAYDSDGDGDGDNGEAKRPRRSEAQATAAAAGKSQLPGKSTAVASAAHIQQHRQPAPGQPRQQAKRQRPPSQESSQPQQQQLPEGFFDDPMADARARNVPYKDKMDEEMELFAREMREAQAESDLMAEAAEEEADKARYLEEIITQEDTWHRLNELELRKEAAVVKQEAQVAIGGVKLERDHDEAEGDDPQAEEDEVEDALDWRKKKL